jgi:lauroyl/myristoyl acyltransferase
VSGPRDDQMRRPLVSLKDFFWLVYLYPLRLLAAILPVPWLQRIGSMLLPPLHLMTIRWQRLLTNRITAVYQAQSYKLEAGATARRFITNALFRAMDDLVMDKLIAEKRLRRVRLQGQDNLDRALSLGKGVIVLTGHFYANRLAKRYLAQIGYPMASVRNRKPQNRALGRFAKKLLETRYVEFLHGIIKDELFLQDEDCALQIFKRLRLNGLVNIHLDASFSQERVQCPFLNGERWFPAGFLRIVRFTGCCIVPMLCLGNSRDLTVVFKDPLDLEPGADQHEFVSVNLPRMARTLESQILRYPDQWELWDRP